MSIDRSQVPMMPMVQPATTQMADRLEYRRLMCMLLTLVAAALAGWLYLRQASTAAAYWYEIGRLEARKIELRNNIQHLRSLSAKSVSLSELERTAGELGYTRPTTNTLPSRNELVIGDQPSATPAPVEQAEAVQPQRKGLWQRFKAWLNAEPGT
ncbi:MAG: hypothetical protein GXY52_00850 [Chloroflexi bacterium]|nr:hypothetical protein [Chloroflexota bacterium]